MNTEHLEHVESLGLGKGKTHAQGDEQSNLAYTSEHAQDAQGTHSLWRREDDRVSRERVVLEHSASITVEEIAQQMRRSGSGLVKALATYLEKPNAERLGWLTGAVLHVRGHNIGEWKRHAETVEEAAGDPNNHPLDCECGECA
jgi:hypothetical protein